MDSGIDFDEKNKENHEKFFTPTTTKKAYSEPPIKIKKEFKAQNLVNMEGSEKKSSGEELLKLQLEVFRQQK